MNDWVFYSVSLWIIFACLSVALSAYPVRSVISLISAFVATSVLWIGIGAEFLGLALIFVYVGAVMALFLFIVFMLNIDKLKTKISASMKYLMLILLTGSLGFIIYKGFQVVPQHSISVPQAQSNTKEIGVMLYQNYGLAFIYVGLILLSAMVAAIGLVGKRPQTAKYQNIKSQINRKVEDSITWMEQ